MPTGTFLDDVASEAELARRLVDETHGELSPVLAAASEEVKKRPLLILAGMGSSLAAAATVCPRLNQRGWFAIPMDAGEVLHHGLPGLAATATVILISQSGRSAETVRLMTALRTAPDWSVIAVTNDLDSPLARGATVTLPIRAGEEQAVATKTFLATLVVLHALVDRLVDENCVAEERLGPDLRLLEATVSDLGAAETWADHLASVSSLALVGRGAALGLAHYGSITLEETARLPAQPFAGGAFRHGPLELAAPELGVIVLAGAEHTRPLQLRLARDASRAGARVWIIDSDSPSPVDLDGLQRLRIESGDELGNQLVTAAVLQLFAAALAKRRGYEPGVMRHSSKVTDME